MEVLNDILGYKNRKIFQDNDCFSFSLDSIMLANFATIRLRDKNIVDLGCGNGVIPLILSLRTDKKIIGVEIQEKIANMAKRSIDINNLSEQIEIINMNMKEFSDSNYFESFDLVTCNPPYFKVNEKNFFNDTATTEIYTAYNTLSLHDALPIWRMGCYLIAAQVVYVVFLKKIFVV